MINPPRQTVSPQPRSDNARLCMPEMSYATACAIKMTNSWRSCKSIVNTTLYSSCMAVDGRYRDGHKLRRLYACLLRPLVPYSFNSSVPIVRATKRSMVLSCVQFLGPHFPAPQYCAVIGVVLTGSRLVGGYYRRNPAEDLSPEGVFTNTVALDSN